MKLCVFSSPSPSLLSSIHEAQMPSVKQGMMKINFPMVMSLLTGKELCGSTLLLFLAVSLVRISGSETCFFCDRPQSLQLPFQETMGFCFDLTEGKIWWPGSMQWCYWVPLKMYFFLKLSLVLRCMAPTPRGVEEDSAQFSDHSVTRSQQTGAPAAPSSSLNIEMCCS